MELKLDPRAKFISLPTSPAAEKSDSPPAASTRAQARQDKIELSQAAVDYVNSQAAAAAPEQEQELTSLTPAQQRDKKKSIQRQAARQMLQALRTQNQQMKDDSNQQAEAINKALDQMKKCSKIASRIQKGGRIPPEDEQYLLEHDPKLYMMAMLMRMMEQNKEDKKYESVLDEEDLQDGQQDSGGTDAVDAAEGPAVEGASEAGVE